MKLIFINTLPTSKIFGNKVDAWWFSYNGFDVEFWDASPLFWSTEQLLTYYSGSEDYRYIGPNHKVFNDKMVLIEELKTLQKGTAIFYLSRNVYKHVNDNWLLYLIQILDLTLYFQGFDTLLSEGNTKKIFINYLRLFKHQFLNRNIKPKFFFGCGSFSRKLVSKFYKKCNFISIASPKIDWSLKKRLLDYDYIVFVDEGLEYLPDAKMFGKEVITDKQGYYKRMNHIFNEIEKWTNLPIIIAASGKYKYENNIYNNRIIEYGKTFELMEYSSIVLGHFSSALDYNLKIQKPIIQFDDISFTNYLREVFCDSFPLIGKNPIMTQLFDKNIFEKEILRDKTYYNELLERYFIEKSVSCDYRETMAEAFRKNHRSS